MRGEVFSFAKSGAVKMNGSGCATQLYVIDTDTVRLQLYCRALLPSPSALASTVARLRAAGRPSASAWGVCCSAAAAAAAVKYFTGKMNRLSFRNIKNREQPQP